MLHLPLGSQGRDTTRAGKPARRLRTGTAPEGEARKIQQIRAELAACAQAHAVAARHIFFAQRGKMIELFSFCSLAVGLISKYEKWVRTDRQTFV